MTRRHELGAVVRGAAFAALVALSSGPSRAAESGMSPRSRLYAEIGPVRPLTARLSGFEYRPLEQRTQFMGRELETYTVPPQLELAQVGALSRFTRAAEASYTQEATPQSMADAALSILLEQKPDRLLTAVTLLEASAAASPRKPALLSDLAAAYLASNRPRPNRMLALGAASVAVLDDPSFAPARFNLALAIEGFGLTRQARKAWDDYLRIDADSGWAAEAREHLQRLGGPSPEEIWRFQLHLVAAYGIPLSLPAELREVTREAVTEDLLGSWAVLRAEGRAAEAEQKLTRVRQVGWLFGNTWSEKTVLDSLSAIDEAEGDERRLRRLAAGHRAYQEAARLMRDGRFDLAGAAFEQASSALAGTGSPLLHWTHGALAELAVLAADCPKAEALVASVRDVAHLSRYPALSARLLVLDGRLSAAQGDVMAARGAFRAAESAARLAQEHEVASAANLLLAESVDFGSAVDWQQLRAARHELRYAPRLRLDLWSLRDLAHALGDEPATALALLDLGLADAAALEDTAAAVPLLLERLRINGQTADRADAERDASRLARTIAGVEDMARRDAFEVEAAIVRCQALPSAARDCLTVLSRAIADAAGRDRRLAAAAHEARGVVRRRHGDAMGAEQDLLAAVALYESGVLALRRPQENRELVDQVVALQAARGDTYGAFDLDERARALTLPRKESPRPPGPLGYSGCNLRPYSPNEFLHGLPAYTTIVEYHVAKAVSADIIRRGEQRRVELGVTAQQLLEALATDRSQRTLVLSDLLLKPLKAWLPAEGEILFLAPQVLWNVSFDSLFVEPGRRLCARQGVAVTQTELPFPSQPPGGVVELARSVLTGQLDTPRAKAPSFLPSRSTLSRLPTTTALLKYRLLDGRLYIWVARNTGTSLTSVALSGSRLSTLVDELALGAQRLATEGDIGATLFDLLVAPVRARLVGCPDLIVIPDPAMAGLPFALLRDRRSGRRLIEDHSITVSPTASLYVDQRLRHGAPDHSQWSVLTVSDVAPGPADAARVPLPGGLAETAAIRKLFPRSESISNALPEPPVSREPGFHLYPSSRTFRDHAVIHFAGHWDPDHPTYDLTSRGADKLPISANTRLVVLAACDTLRSSSWRDQSGFGLAYQHLSAGVPAVVASLWQLDDAATSRLMVRFYEGLRDGMDVANSLRAAQLSLLHGEDRSFRQPRAWAGMQVVGFGGI